MQLLLASLFVTALTWSLKSRTVIAQATNVIPGKGQDFSSSPANRAETTNVLEVSENASVYWNNVILEAIRMARPGPPVVARALAMVHTAQYEAWSQYDESAVGTLLGSRFRQPVKARTLANKSVAMSYAAYRVLVDLFPDLRYLFDAAMDENKLDPDISTTNPSIPSGMGNLAAAVVLYYRHHDGSNQLGDLHPGAYSDYTNYVPTNTPTRVVDLNLWQPLQTPNGSFQGGCIDDGTVTTQTYVGPQWGSVIPFALDDGEILTPTEGPALYPSAEFTLQAQEIISISANLTDKEKLMAEYWADGPASEFPAGHWALFAQFVSKRDQHTLDEDARLFFALTNANLDASILAWKLKRIYNSVRPITAIRELFRGQEILSWAGPFSGTQTILGESWQPYQQLCFVTPAFPEFISGHSTFSAASAEVLERFTGSDTFSNSVTIEHSLTEPGLVPAQPVTLTWMTFSEAADEAGMSRRYGGIHFTAGDLTGRVLGRKVGERVWSKSTAFFEGSALPMADMQQEITDFVAVDNFDLIFSPYRLFLPVVSKSVAKR